MIRICRFHGDARQEKRDGGTSETVGILKEIETEENRVCMTPAGVETMRMSGHEYEIYESSPITKNILSYSVENNKKIRS